MRTKPLVSGLLIYAAVIAVKCPCPKTLSCHLPHFFLSTGLAGALVAWENGLLRVL
jgi:hypothetical protein